MSEPQEKPTKAQIDEVTDPSLSKDSFKVGDKEIPIQILPIAYEKKILLAIDPILKKVSEWKPESVWDFLGKMGGQGLADCADALIEFVHIICKKHDSTVTTEYIEENLCAADLLAIFVKQLNKNKIGDLVSGFFYQLLKMMPATGAVSLQNSES